jgi:predicted nucleic acid-binding protein
VNALLALAHQAHSLHARVEDWVAKRRPADRLATTAITELGFVRVAPQARLSPDVRQARALLEALKQSRRPRFVLLADALGAEALPGWVTSPAQTTDGHLLALAAGHRAKLVTCDAGIPGAQLIP